MSATASYRGTVLLLWALAAVNAVACRGLFWDGSAFLASLLETGTFHDFYPARAHIAWLTQAPVLLLAKAGVRDVHVLAMMFSMSTILAPLSGGLGNLTFRLPLQSIPVIGIGLVLMALFVAAGMMIFASFAHNFKEGQSMVSPFYLIIILPVSFLQAPGTEFTMRLALIPVVNVVVGVDFRVPSIRGWEATIEGGFYDAFFLGGSVGYTF